MYAVQVFERGDLLYWESNSIGCSIFLDLVCINLSTVYAESSC